MCAKKTESLFLHEEIFINSLDGIKVQEVENGIYEDEEGKIYAMAFGGESFSVHKNISLFEKNKGRIIYFSINDIKSSFILLEKSEVDKILKSYSKTGIAKTYNDIEIAYYLENSEILLINSVERVGWLFKNIEEMNLINS